MERITSSEDIIQKVLDASGFQELNPPQIMAVESGLLEGKNLVVATPTASGKTTIAEMACLKTFMEGKKSIYIVPLKALASEKYEDFKEKYESIGLRTAISIGDLDSSDGWLSKYDVIVTTSEKLDSLLRHDVSWVYDVGLIVTDEVHLLDSPERGPTLEMVLTRIGQLARPRILALSATINNYKDLADWLGAEGIKSDYRPVKLAKGLFFKNTIDFVPKRKIKLKQDDDPVLAIIEKTIREGKQALVFVSTRRYAESAADKIAKRLWEILPSEEKDKLAEVSSKIDNALEHSTKQCKRLASCVMDGVAFHHAGETTQQRKLIEKAFRDGIIKVITATPTLAFGLNLPAHTVVIRDLKRFSSFKGMDYLPILEVHQMMGRSGRPKYDKEGQAILIAKNQMDAEYAWRNYINGEPENITSKLGVEPVLRMHLLALIASGVTKNKKQVMDFFSKTFYAHQFKDLGLLSGKIDKVLELLEGFGFIEIEGKPSQPASPFKKASDIEIAGEGGLKATRIGKRVSELYVDPLTADEIIKNLKRSPEGLSPFALLQTVADTIEMKPLPSVLKRDYEYLDELLIKESKHVLVPKEWDPEYEGFLRSAKLAYVLQNWVEELGEDRILEDFNMTPGELRYRLERTDWLLYAVAELALLLGMKESLLGINKMRIRTKYGVKEELLPLVKLKGVGRVRARTMYGSGVRGLADLRKIPLESLEKILTPKLARDVKDQLGELQNDG